MARKLQKPSLTVVAGSASTMPKPPPTLGEPGAALWRSIMKEYAIVDSGGLAILEQACALRDRVAEWVAIIAADGPVIRTKQGLKDHPLVRHELAARALICRLLSRLGLDVEPLKSGVGRPGGGVGVTWEQLDRDGH